MGIGEKKTPKPFVNACDVFVYTENLVTETKKQKERVRKPAVNKKKNDKEEKEEPDPMPILEKAYDIAVQEDGWARLDHMGNALYQLDPGFDPRTYGQKQLSRLVISLKEFFEMKTQEIDGSTLFYVKMKDN